MIGRLGRAAMAAALAGAVHAQDARIDEWVADLGRPERIEEAVRGLASRGEPAAAAVATAIADHRFRADAGRVATALWVLGKLGAAATDFVGTLCREQDADDERVRFNALWALGEVGPHVADRKDLLIRVREVPQPPGPLFQEWSFAIRRIELGTAPTAEVLLASLRSDVMDQRVAAASLLASGRGELSPALRRALVQQWGEARASWARWGASWERAYLDVARALSARLPDSGHVVTARVDLLRHFDPDVRLEAVFGLRGEREHTADAVQGLASALRDGSPCIRREAVTALGMLGPAARPVRDQVATLCDDPDVQVGKRAEAALRAIDRDR